MTSKKIGKILLVLLCIITLVLPFGTEVLAAALTKDSTTAVLGTIAYREGGPESTGITSSKYDKNSYAYKISRVNVLKIIQSNDTTFADTIYCVNALLSFSVSESCNYKKVADNFAVSSDSEVAKWSNSVGISTENYNSLIYLINHLYLKKIDTSYKDTYIQNAFGDYIEEHKDEEGAPTVESIKTLLTDDDIDVIQQWAIWYFTNGTTASSNEYHDEIFASLGNIQVTYPFLQDGEVTTKTEDLTSIRQTYAGILYDYLISSAKANATNGSDGNGEATYPTIDRTRAVTSTVSGEEYKVGPFKINGGNTAPLNYKAEFVTEGGDLPSTARIEADGEDVTNSFDGVELNKEYYIYLPIENNTITSIKLTSAYDTAGRRNASLWTGESDTQHLQPVILITQDPGEPVEEEIVGLIIPEKYDLALRKFVVSINGDAVTGRTPVPTPESLRQLAAGTIDTAEYTHSKQPLEVKKGDKVVFEFRIYNEGNINAKVKKIVDYLPNGLTVVNASESTVNSKYNWNQEGTTLTNTYLENTTIPALDKDNLSLSYGTVQIECEITGDLSQGTVLTNVAEIVLDNGNDKDSHEGSIDKNTITEDFSGDPSNKADLSDENYYYKGLEDDDDFEKLIIEGKEFDLNLKKFISKVNTDSQSREPKPDVTPLNNGADDADYKTTKTPINVETGDIVTFTLRVYNEGDIDGYAEKITDYIPEGLGFLVNYNTNYDNYWSIAEDAKSVKLSTIKNATSNVSLSDFKDVQSLEDVEVVVGKTKVTSTALSSSDTSTTNLIKAFDGTTLSYKDIKIACVVTTEDEIVLKNIAAITGESDKDRKPVEQDRDSKPNDDIDPDKYDTGNEDDDDYDVVKTDKKNFDLALQKFITALNEKEVTNRVPTVSIDSDGKIKYAHTDEALKVGNRDLVTYTIRVYNEGNIDGYAKEVGDDIPKGLVYLPDNQTNKDYGWKMYDKSGNETTDVNQAASVKTEYLSKDKSEDNIIKAFDGKTVAYKDVKLVFKVNESKIDKTVTTSERTLINTAEITKHTDSNGDPIKDMDSEPGNGEPNEDDIDKEQVYIKYFDLALQKDLTKILITEGDKTTELMANGDAMKVEVHRKRLPSTSIKFIYNITIKNEGEIEGYATEITDVIPEGLEFHKEDNADWEQISENTIRTNALAKTLLQPNETASVPVVLRWKNDEKNIGKFVNIAEISDDWNPYDSPDVDSTPNNMIPEEDDYDTAPVWVGIVTGIADQPYILLTSTVLLILGTGIFLIKKYVL